MLQYAMKRGRLLYMFSKNEIISLCNKFGKNPEIINSPIDSSKGDNDRRFNYVIDNEYVLKINNHNSICEEFLINISKLQERYKSIGVYCPKLFKGIEGKYSYTFFKDNCRYVCYIEEFAKYKILQEEEIDYEFKEKMLEHLGKIASKYTNVDLVDTKSMWTIIDLGPFDKESDEKQDNIEILVNCLNKNGYELLAEKILQFNNEARTRILEYFALLPRCVYQGDLNASNILIDKNNEFKGIIDFNMFGTEVNINCFLNEAMYYMTSRDFEELNAIEIFEKTKNIQNKLISSIFRFYTLNNTEKLCFEEYKKIIFIAFYPNVMLWVYLINNHKNEDKVIALLQLICEM